ncbi:MAG: hypothetical protein ACYCYO_21150 [Bacilli bacterium]
MEEKVRSLIAPGAPFASGAVAQLDLAIVRSVKSAAAEFRR